MIVLATLSDVEVRLGRALAEDETLRAAGLLEELTVLAMEAVPQLTNLEQPPPAGVVVAVSRTVAQAMSSRADGVVQESFGPFARRYATGGQVELTGGLRRLLASAVGVHLPRGATNMSTL